MTDDVDEKLYGLIETAERQQEVVQTAIAGLAREREALAEERGAWVAQFDTLHEELTGSVTGAVYNGIADMTDRGTQAIAGLSGPFAETLAGLAEHADAAETALRNIVRWAGARLVGSVAAIVGAALLLWWLACSALLWWDTSAVGAAQVRKAELQAELAEMRATRDAWAAAGLLARLERCGAKRLPCVRIDKDAGAFGEGSDYRVLRSYR